MSDQSLIDKPRPVDADSIDADSLEAIRHAVTEKLRREYHQSSAFAADTADEMVDQAYVEFAERSQPERDSIRSLPGLLITTAVRRALDKARREGREVYGETAQAIIDDAEDLSPSTEALAVRGIEATELYEAVRELHPEQRRALALLYWEGLSTRQAAERMGVGTMTVCRRRDDAMDALRARFGVDSDDPIDRHLGREAGFSAWAVLMVGGGGNALARAGAAGHGLGTIWHSVTGIVGRVRDLAVRLSGSGGSEGLSGAVSNGSASGLAKAGACVLAGSAAIYCGAGAVGIGPGLSVIGVGGGHAARPAAARPHAPPRSTVRQPPTHSAASPSGSGSQERRTSHSSRRNASRRTVRRKRDKQGRKYTVPAERAARGQTLASQSPAPTPEAAPEPVPEPEPTYVGEPEGGGSTTASSAASEQFDLP